MKKLLLLMSLTAFCLAGCFDAEEDVTIKTDGSGIYKNTLDMSGLFDMIQMAAMMDTSANSELKNFSDKDIDSTVSLRSFTDTATALTAEEKALLKEGTMHFQVNQKEKLFKITMAYPFKKTEDLQKILQLQKSNKGFNPFKSSKETSALEGLDEEGLPSADEMMEVTYKNGLIERKLDAQKLDALKSKGDNDMDKMQDMMSAITFGTVIHLPKPVKSAKGDKITISDDKRTVRIKYNLLDLKTNPKSLEFKIEY